MDRPEGRGDPIIRASVGRHLAFAPVAFAVTEGPAHAVVYANTIFRRLQTAGKIRIGAPKLIGLPQSSTVTPRHRWIGLHSPTVRVAWKSQNM